MHEGAATNDSGVFTFNNVPFNPYELHADVQGFAPAHQAVDVHSPVPVDVTLQLSMPAVSESIQERRTA